MSDFLGSDFLLQSPVSRMLYREHAASKPIIDYHCHLDPALIAADRRFASITALWLGGDHYKWRAMRANGVNERFITGDASDWEKFEKWAETVPYAFRNPLYHWTHMELRTAFGIDETLNPESARRIFDECNAQLRDKESMTPRGLMRHYGVETVCTTDDPADTLEHHRCVHFAEYKQHLALESAHIVLGKRLASHHSGENAHNIRLVKILITGLIWSFARLSE